jgi:hypothetical protein
MTRDRCQVRPLQAWCTGPSSTGHHSTTGRHSLQVEVLPHVSMSPHQNFLDNPWKSQNALLLPMKYILIHDNFTVLWWVFARNFTQLRRHLEDILTIPNLPVASQLTPKIILDPCVISPWFRMSEVAKPTETTCNFWSFHIKASGQNKRQHPVVSVVSPSWVADDRKLDLN